MEKTEILDELADILDWTNKKIDGCIYGRNGYVFPIEKSISKDELEILRAKIFSLGNKIYEDIKDN